MSITPLPNFKFQVEDGMDIFKTNEKPVFSSHHKVINKTCRIAWNIFSVVVFPIGVARLVVFAAKHIAPRAVLPAAAMFNLDEKEKDYEKSSTTGWAVIRLEMEIIEIISLHEKREDFIANPSNHAEQVTVRTADDVDLDTLSIEHIKQKKKASEQKWIVYFLGNAMCYEQALEQIKIMSERTGASILTGNYRGVMRSQGAATSSHDLILDGEAMVQYLLNKGVPPENILLHGLSLGGAVATEVAAYHQEKDHEMHLCNERSFSHIAKLLKARCPRALGAILGQIVLAAGWRFDSLKNFQKINGYKFTIHSQEDGVIRYEASLYKCLKEQNMTPLDRKLKAQRVKAKKQGEKPVKNYNTDYKPEKAIRIPTKIFDENGQLSRNEIIKKYGLTLHGGALTAIEDVFNSYVKQTKEALKIA